MNQNNKIRNNQAPPNGKPKVSRGAALRAQKRNQEDAQKIINQYNPAQTNGPQATTSM